MAKYVITSPDGRKFQITAPDGASQADVLAFAQKQFAGSVQPQTQGPTREQLSNAFYAAKQAGNEGDARKIIGYIQKNGMTLAPMNEAQQNAAFQKANAKNVAGMSTVAKLLAGAGKSFVDTGRGIGELLGIESPQDVANARQADRALMNTTAGQIGYGGGTAAQIVGGAALGGLAAGAPVLAGMTAATPTLGGALASGALTGMAYGDVAPYASTGEHVANIVGGGLLGPALAGGVKGLQLVGRGGKVLLERYFAPDTVAATRMGKALASDGIAPQQLRANANAPTVAQAVTNPEQTPKLVQIERAARNNPVSGPEIASADAKRRAAQVGQLRQYEGRQTVGSLLTPDGPIPLDARDAGAMTRNANFQRFADQYLGYSTPADRWNKAIGVIDDALANGRMSGADRDALRSARTTARKVVSGDMHEDDAAQEMADALGPITSKTGQTAADAAMAATTRNMASAQPIIDEISKLEMGSASRDNVARNALNAVRAQLQDRIDSRGNVPLSIVDGIRASLGGTIRQEAMNAGANGARANVILAPLRDALTETVSAQAPAYRQALRDYADQSVLPNTADAFRTLLNPDSTVAQDFAGTPIIPTGKLDSFLTKNREFTLDPSAMDAVRSVQEAQKRTAAAQRSIGPVGSPTEENRLNQLVSQGARHIGAGAGTAVGFGVGGPAGGFMGALAGHGADMLDRYAQNRIAGSVGRLLMNPNASADALERYLLLQGRRQSFNNLLVPVGRYGGVSGLLASPTRTGGGQ